MALNSPNLSDKSGVEKWIPAPRLVLCTPGARLPLYVLDILKEQKNRTIRENRGRNRMERNPENRTLELNLIKETTETLT